MEANIFGRKVRAARRSCGLTTRQLAESIGVTKQTVNYWEKGKALPRDYQLGALADALILDVRDLLGMQIEAKKQRALEKAIRNAGVRIAYEKEGFDHYSVDTKISFHFSIIVDAKSKDEAIKKVLERLNGNRQEVFDEICGKHYSIEVFDAYGK